VNCAIKAIRVGLSQKISFIPSGASFQTLDLENLATARSASVFENMFLRIFQISKMLYHYQ